MRDFSTVGFSLLVVSLSLTAACGGTEETNPPGSGGSGGTTAGTGGATAGMGTGGATAGMGTGGATAGMGTGGATAGTGGAAAGTGGAAAGTGGSGAGTGGAAAGTGGSAGGGASDSPSDTTQAGIEAFITAASFKNAPWVSGTTGPVDSTSVHSRNQIWYNRTMRQSFADGNTTMHTQGSMAIKEILMDSTVIGHAAMLRTATGWIYYCVASEAGRCTTSSMPNTASYGTTAGSCNCHGGGTIVSQEMIPDP